MQDRIDPLCPGLRIPNMSGVMKEFTGGDTFYAGSSVRAEALRLYYLRLAARSVSSTEETTRTDRKAKQRPAGKTGRTGPIDARQK